MAIRSRMKYLCTIPSKPKYFFYSKRSIDWQRHKFLTIESFKMHILQPPLHLDHLDIQYPFSWNPRKWNNPKQIILILILDSCPFYNRAREVYCFRFRFCIKRFVSKFVTDKLNWLQAFSLVGCSASHPHIRPSQQKFHKLSSFHRFESCSQIFSTKLWLCWIHISSLSFTRSFTINAYILHIVDGVTFEYLNFSNTSLIVTIENFHISDKPV